jgi:GTP cyclohydrolase I
LKERKRDARAEACAKTLIDAILHMNCAENPELVETPRRIADLYADMTEGLCIDIKEYFDRPLPSKHNEMTVIKDIEFVSMCEHHWWPFFGKVHVAYVPHGKIVGLSKFHSAVRALARRPQLQERMTTELANTIDECLQPKGCMVVVEGTHTCMLVGGRYDYGMPAHTDSRTVTSAIRGVFLMFEPPRNEAMKLMGLGGGEK